MSRAARPSATDLERSLAPVRTALVDDARAEAEALVAAARRDADQLVAAAEAEVADQVDDARRRGERTARARAERELARARGEAHARVLAAESELRDRWIERVHERLPELRDGPDHDRLAERLEQLARTQLGDDATIEHAADGGIVATSRGRRVDYRLAALADRAVELIAEEATRSWT